MAVELSMALDSKVIDIIFFILIGMLQDCTDIEEVLMIWKYWGFWYNTIVNNCPFIVWLWETVCTKVSCAKQVK